MNQNGQTTTVKRNKNRLSGVSNSSSMSSNNHRSNRPIRNNCSNIRGGNDGNISSSSSPSSTSSSSSSTTTTTTSLQRNNIHSSKSSSSSQSMMISQTSGTNHHSYHHTTTNTASLDNNDVPCNSGVYANKRLVHLMTSLIGCLIEVRLSNGKRYEGILKTFSSEFELALSSATLIDNVDEEKRCQSSNSSSGNNIGNLLAALECDENVIETLVINPKNLITFKALNVDLDFATKKAVMTDSEIAKHDGTTKQYRDLVPWDDGDDMDGNDSSMLDSLDDHSGLSLSGGNMTNGWNTEDMFKLNESKYNIETTYQEDMSQYTIKLEHRNDDEYRQREAQAAKIAREIEQDSSRIARYSKEDELDEESRYSAVIRGDSDNQESGNNISISNNNNNNNNNNSHHHHNYRNEMNHHSSRDQSDRNRDNNLRNSNSGDNLSGFRTQNSRQNRNRLSNNRSSAGGSSMGSNESNWRDTNNRINPNHRYHNQQQQQQQQMPYGQQNANKSNYVDRKYNSQQQQQQSPSQQQQPQQTYQSSAVSQANNNNKSSYSSVSARNVSNDVMASNNEMEHSIKTFTRSSGQHNQPPTNDADNVGYPRKTSTGSNVNSLPQRESFKQQRTPYNLIVEQQQQQQQPPQQHHHHHHHHHHHPQQQQHHSIQQSNSESKMPLQNNNNDNNKSLDSSDLSSTKSSLPTSPSSGTSSNISTPTAESSLLKSPLTNLTSKSIDIHQSKSNDHLSQARITSPKHGLDVGNNNNNNNDSNNNTRKPVDATEDKRPTMVEAVKKGANLNQHQQPGKSLITNSKDNLTESKKDPATTASSSSATSSLSASSTLSLSPSSSSPSTTSLNNATSASNSITTTISFTTTINTPVTTTSSSVSSANTVQHQQQQQQQQSLMTNTSSPSSLMNDTNEIVVTSKLNPNAKIFTPRAVQIPTSTPPQQTNPQQVVPVQPITYASPHVPYSPVAAGHISATTPPTPSLAGPSGTIVPNGQFISYAHPGTAAGPGPHMTHHTQQQSIRYPLQFSYNPMVPQMVPQYIAIHQHFPTPGAVTATAPPTSVVASQSSDPSNQPPPPPGSSHHMIAANASMATQASAAGPNSLVQTNGHSGPQTQPQQPVNQSQTRGHYRSGGGNKGGMGGNPNANQQPPQQQMIRHQHHEAFVSQQAQVASVTGQPIMTGATQPQHLPVVFQAQPVHHHHHAQNQIHHGQPGGQNAAMAAHIAASTQPGHQALTPYMYSASFPPRPLLAAHQSHHHHPNTLNMTIQPGLYPPPDAHMQTVYMPTEMPPPHQIVTAQSLPPNAMVPPPATNIPQTIVPVPTSGNGAGPVAVVSTTQSSPQGAVSTSQQSQQQPTYG